MNCTFTEFNGRDIALWARLLSRLATETWRETFVGRGYYTAEIVEGYVSEAFAVAKITAELADHRNHFLVVKSGEDVVGYAKIEERSVEACISTTKPLYLSRFYLVSSAHGKGVAKKLLDAVCAKALVLGYESLWLSVWELNVPAVKFYLKHGFKKDGAWEYPFTSHGKHYVDIDWLMSFRISGNAKH